MSVLSMLKIDTWTTDRVVSWLTGLNSSVASYAECFTEAGITGRQLLMLTNDDLEQIGVKKLGHQEILLQSIALLQSLTHQLENETLLSAALRLSCCARNLTNELKVLMSLSESASRQSSEYSVQRRHYVSVLLGVSHTVNSIKTAAAMIDRIPFEAPECDMYDGNKHQLIDYGLKLLDLSDSSVVSESSSQEAIMSVDLHQRDPVIYPQPEISGMLEFEWSLFLEGKRKELRDEMWVFDDKALCFANEILVGGPQEFMRWAEEEHAYENFRPLSLYSTLAEEAYHLYRTSSKHEFVFLDTKIGADCCGQLVIELFNDIVPKTCENFRALCTGEHGESPNSEFQLHYEGSLIHRVVPNGWIQGGDIWMKRGDGGESIYGAVFEDENFVVSHDRRGIVGMANKGRHTNGSQFYITLQPAKWMDTKYVAFGKVVEGTAALAAIEKEETVNERPVNPITISNCGVSKFVF